MSPKLQRIHHWVIWNIVSRTMVRLWIKPWYNFDRTPDSDPTPEPPFVIVGNHGTFFDPWMVGYYSTVPLNFMTNDDGFRAPRIVQWYLRSIGAFPKKKGGSDYKAMKETLRRLVGGSPVCIFPEGQTSWDGETQLIYKGIEKIIKRARCPLVMVRLRGNFLTKPWWAKSKRKGRIALTYKTLPAEVIAKLSDDQVFKTIKEYIHHSDIKDEANRAVLFRGKGLAEGLERFVWQCMDCRAEDTLEPKGDVIACTSCGKSWTLDSYCRLKANQQDTETLADLKDWSEWLKSNVKQKIAACSAQDPLTTSEEVALQTLSDDGSAFVERSRGMLVLSPTALTYTPQAGETIAFEVPKLETVVFQKQELFEFLYHGDLYRFHVPNHSPMKWVVYLRYLTGYDEAERRGYL